MECLHRWSHGPAYTVFTGLASSKCYHYNVNIEGRVDLGSIEVRNNQGSSLPVKRCELTKGEPH